MLFSNLAIAQQINEKFEPVWISLRPVPRVTIDFGNGNVVKRTLHGNIATWVCAANGTAIDVLPGIYKPEAYSSALHKLLAVHSDYKQISRSAADFLAEYHKGMLEPRIRISSTDTDSKWNATDIPGLTEDTELNETVRRAVVHRELFEHGQFLIQSEPGEVTRWLYRELLHADLDDPYLGLGDKLFGSYPFTEEDAEIARK